MRLLLAFIAGGLFGSGLLISGMTDTRKVQGWLDVFGAWDPTLAFVMGGAMLPMAVAWQLARGGKPFLAREYPGPASRVIDARLLGGAALFGLGWGLVGLCPGPALAVLSLDGWPAWLFAAAMLGGMVLANFLSRRSS